MAKNKENVEDAAEEQPAGDAAPTTNEKHFEEEKPKDGEPGTEGAGPP